MKLRFETLLWLMPCAFAAHILEEWFGGFPRYVAEEMHGSVMSPAMFIANNTFFMVVLIVLSAWATRSSSRLSGIALMSWASGNLFWDFLVHLAYTVGTRHLMPGLATAALLYYPLPFIVARSSVLGGRLTIRDNIAAFAIGAALMLFVLWAGVYHFSL